MTGILKVDQWKDSGDNALMTSDGAGNLTANTGINVASSNNLLVGKTTTTRTDVGSEMRSTGFIRGTRLDGHPFDAVRTNSDGDIMRFYRDAGQVGQITAYTTGISINLGGTGAANALDDYEEGTYSGEVRDSNSVVPSQSAVGHYVKIGNNITVHGQISLTGATSGTGITYITLPFTVKSNARGGMGIGLVTGGIVSMSSNNKTLNLIPEVNSTAMYFVETDYTGTHTHLTFNSNFGSGGIFSYSGSYITN